MMARNPVFVVAALTAFLLAFGAAYDGAYPVACGFAFAGLLYSRLAWQS